jgi:acyl carrier protein phosphodiesterase
MNFIGHLHVARWQRETPAFLLGAMLPDFAGMAGVRLLSIGDPELEAGVRLHHRTDDVFHGAPAFSALVQETIATLTARGVERGPARAVGHIGVEMLIDGELLREGTLGSAYLSALVAFQEVSSALSTRFCARAEPRAASADGALATLITRLIRYGIPHDYERPEAVTARVSSVLARRPRLALTDAAQAIVGSIMPDLKARVVVCLPELLAHLARGPLDPSYSETITR